MALFFVIPAYNEEANLPGVLEAIRNSTRELGLRRIIIVNDGSSDRTHDVAAAHTPKLPVCVIDHPANRGAGRAFDTGFRSVLAEAADDDFIVTLESDNTSDLGILGEMLARLEDGAAVALASCYAPGGRLIHVPWQRSVMSRAANVLVRHTLGLQRIHTCTSFFRAYRCSALRAAYDRYGNSLILESGFVCAAEILSKIDSLGLRIDEVPTTVEWGSRKDSSRMRVGRTILNYARFLGPHVTRRLAVPITIVTFTALFVIGLLVNLHYAGDGFMPLDQSIVFDGGWRVLSGQVPFREFSPTTGMLPSVLQAAFFRGFGVTWFAYALHASVFNGLFCCVGYALLRLLQCSRSAAFFYAALSAFCFYPAIGTPYMEQHAFFFVLTGITMLVWASTTQRKGLRTLLWGAFPAIVILTFLSKQNVAVFALPCYAAASFVGFRDGKAMRPMLYAFAIGSVASAVLVVVLGMLLHIDPHRVWVDLIQVPSEIGGGRFAQPRWGNLARTRLLISPQLIAFVAFTFVVANWIGSRRSSSDRFPLRLDGAGVPREITSHVALSLSCIVLSWIFVTTTANQPENGFPFLFLSLGIFHQATAKWLADLGHFFLRSWVQIFFVLCAAADLSNYLYFDKLRYVLDMEFAASKAPRPSTEALHFMRFQVAMRSPVDPNDSTPPLQAGAIDEFVKYFSAPDRNFFLVGDSSILYGICGKPSPSPYLWFHQGMKLPSFRQKRLASYEDELMQNLKRDHVRYVAVEGRKTWVGVTLGDLPTLRQFVDTHTIRKFAIGTFQIFELQ